MFSWIWNLFINSEYQIKPYTDDELRIRKPKIYMCKIQRCKNGVNYTFYEAYEHEFKCLDCESRLIYT